MIIFIWTILIIHILGTGVICAQLGGNYPRVREVDKRQDWMGLVVAIAIAIWCVCLLV